MTASQQAFIASIAPGAADTMKLTGIPASVTIAQAILETGWGKSVPPGSCNYFGIKATPGQPYVTVFTNEFVNGTAQRITQEFAKYDDPAEGFYDHARLLSTDARYAPAYARRNNAIVFAALLEYCGYSTNRPPLAKQPPYYADTLIQLILDYNLLQYDKEVA